MAILVILFVPNHRMDFHFIRSSQTIIIKHTVFFHMISELTAHFLVIIKSIEGPDDRFQ